MIINLLLISTTQMTPQKSFFRATTQRQLFDIRRSLSEDYLIFLKNNFRFQLLVNFICPNFVLVPEIQDLNVSLIIISKNQQQSTRGVLKIFAKFTKKHLCQSLFLCLRLVTLLKKPLEQLFCYDFCEFLTNTFFYMEHLWWLLLENKRTKN